MPVPPFSAAWRSAILGLILVLPALAQADSAMRLVSLEVLELEWVLPHVPEKAGPAPQWNLAPAADLVVPEPGRFLVTAAGRPVEVAAVGLKRRVASATREGPELQLATWLYLRLALPVDPRAEIRVANPDGGLWDASVTFHLPPAEDGARVSPAIHVSHEGYAAGLPKKALVGHYLGTLGELPVAARDFLLRRADGSEAFAGRLSRRAEKGYAYQPAPYQEVWEADFSGVDRPGLYWIEIPGVGRSETFRIGNEIVLGAARAYALGLYHQRCGAANELPFTRFLHAPCHLAQAAVPLPAPEHAFTWATLARLNAAAAGAAGPAPAIVDEASQLYPFVRRGAVDVAGGHHDAGDYSKYTTNSASFIHVMVFAADVLTGAADRDDLGLPESGDGIPDLLQLAKWEADFLAKLQDDDGGFYFLVYPRGRAYEHDVPPDRGDPQVVWPKNTAATAAAVAALAQAGSSPAFRRHFPDAAAAYLARAERGWRFLEEARARHGAAAYQRLTHYGDTFRDADELAWAACELYLATGRDEYHRSFRERCDPADGATRRWGWWRMSESWGHAIRSYAFAARSGRRPAAALHRAMLDACEREVEAAAHDVARWAADSAYGTSLPVPTRRVRGGGWYFSLAQAFDLAVASELAAPPASDPHARYLEAYAANLAYELGGNPVNLCYITGLGRRAPREIVHQHAQNDRRALPPSGLPVGNVQAGLPYLPAYQAALRMLSFPGDGAASAPYPYYDRWSDLPNVSTEFVIVDQARALAGLCWLAGRLGLPNRPWRAAPAAIGGLPAKARAGQSLRAHLRVPDGLRLEDAEITWEASGGQEGRRPDFAFEARGHGPAWVEAEARWPDGRRVFAVAGFECDNGLPTVWVETTGAEAAAAAAGRVAFRRRGPADAALRVHFQLRGSAAKWKEYRRPEGDMPTEITIPAGRTEAELAIVPVPAALGPAPKDVVFVVAPDAAYNVGEPAEATVRLRP